MAVSIAEYLGMRTDGETVIKPVEGSAKCPFMEANCSKLKENNKPICSVKKTNGDYWIVCKHRLCATLKNVDLNFHQKKVLLSVAKTIWGDDIEAKNIQVKREVRIPVIKKSNYNADYIMVNNSDKTYNCPKKVILEMQGGGETSNTGFITKRVIEWENNPHRTNADLSLVVKKAGTIETNAWRRQQEQFIIKGNIAVQTGGGIVFCVGKPLFDYLYQRFATSNLRDLKTNNWSLCLIGFADNKSDEEQQSIDYRIDKSRVLFTNYNSFVQALTNQGNPYPEMFLGDFDNILE